MKGLWIGRFLPFSRRAGDAAYSRGIATALTHAGVELTVMGLRDPSGDPQPAAAERAAPEWSAVEGGRRPDLRAIASALPLEAGRFGTRAYRAALRQMLDRDFDAIFLDHYAAIWALDVIERRFGRRGRPLLVHVSHDFSSLLTAEIVRNYTGDPLRRLLLRMNGWKVRRAEARLVQACDLITCNTEADRDAYAREFAPRATLVLRPGYDKARVERRTITERTPRRAVILGSFHWIAKQMNLATFLEVADPIFAAAGIELHVIGEVPADFQDAWRPKLRATMFRGFVDSLDDEMETMRVGLVAETTGGGFKHKVLDYAFRRVPIAAITGSIAGLPDDFLAGCVFAPDAAALAHATVDLIDDVDRLNRNQDQVYRAATSQFDWDANGEMLAAKLGEIRAAAPRS